MTATTVKIETWLPVFPGFYNTLFEADLDQELYCLTKESKELPETADTGDLLAGWNNGGYELAVVKAICEALTTRGHNQYFPAEAGIINCQLQKIVSPKEYNFTNDSANVEFEIDMALFATWIRQYLLDNEANWETYLRQHYKSRDGFISYYSYDPEDWRHSIEAMLNGIDLVGDDYRRREVIAPIHLLGTLLQFYLLNEDEETVMKMYYDVGDSVYVSEFINLEEVKAHLKKE